jgi:hypothetical protein
MNMTILNYPGFQSLPKGIKKMLLASEAQLFDQPASFHRRQKESGPPQLFGQTTLGDLSSSGHAEKRIRKTELLLDVLHWAKAYTGETKDELGKSANEVIDLIRTIEQKLCPKLE